PVHHLPQHALPWLCLKDLHVETTGFEAELQHSADLAFSLRIGRPPAGKAFTRGQSLISIIQRRRFDSDLVQNVHHMRCLLLGWRDGYLQTMWLINSTLSSNESDGAGELRYVGGTDRAAFYGLV